MKLFTVMYAGMSLILVGLAVPFIRRRVGPNDWAGFRIPATTEDPGVWYPANRYAGWWMLALGLLNSSSAIVLAIWPGMTETIYVSLMTTILLSGLLVGFLFSWKYATRLSRNQ